MKKLISLVFILSVCYLTASAQSEIKVLFGTHESGGKISVKELLEVESIKITSDKYNDSTIKIVSFEIIYQAIKKQAVMAKGRGSLIPTLLKEKFSNASYGDKIIITNITCSIPNQGEKKLKKGLVLTVTAGKD